MDIRDGIVDVAIDGNGQTMGSFIARPASEGTWRNMIGIEGFGVTEHIKTVARHLAGKGFLVVLIYGPVSPAGPICVAEYPTTTAPAN